MLLQNSVAIPGERRRVLLGIGFAALGYSLFSVQDALVKLLVTGFSVPQILFVRSVVITLVALLLTGRNARALVTSPYKMRLAWRTALMFVAWLCFYSAARRLGLAEMTTLYFAAPIIVVALARPVLGERAGAAHWVAVVVGFAGVVLAAGPIGGLDPVPAGMALLAAVCWAGSVLLLRSMAQDETTANVMLFSNAWFAVGCAVMLPSLWHAATAREWIAMLVVGLAGAFGQFLLYRGFRDAPASVLAPVEYTGLIWAFLFGYMIWGDVPGLTVFLGALLIAASSLGLVWYESRRSDGSGAGGTTRRGPRL